MKTLTSRRNFLLTTATGAASLTGGAFAATRATGATLPDSAVAKMPSSLPTNDTDSTPYRPLSRFGLGGVAMGNGFSPASEMELLGAVTAAWDEGVRYFDTSPWYGLGLSERRFGVFLQGKPRGEFALSTKIGRIFTPDASLHFCNAPSVVSSVIPGARTAHQVKQNAAAIRRQVPSGFWAALKREGLIAANAPTPA